MKETSGSAAIGTMEDEVPERNCMELIRQNWRHGKFLCVGLDSDIDKISEKFSPHASARPVADTIFAFNKMIVAETADIVCAYKPNIAFYEKAGEDGLLALAWTIEHIQDLYPTIPVILDAKRGDIGNTNQGYMDQIFEVFGADATTLHPYMGEEALRPFLDRRNKLNFILCRTSNPGAGEFQDLWVSEPRVPLFQYVAQRVSSVWNKNSNCGLVVGATFPEELRIVREIAPNLPILIPGVGTQGGDLEASVRNGKDRNGQGFIINSSSAIIFAKTTSPRVAALNVSAVIQSVL